MFTRLMLVLVVVVASSRAGAAGPVRGDEPLVRSDPPDPELDRQLAAIRAFLEEYTGLTFSRPVTVRRQPAEKFRERQAAGFDKGKAERRADWKLLHGLRLIDSPDRAEEVYRTFLLGAVAGYYSFDDAAVYLPEGDPGEGVTLAHELHHALLDQTFDLGRLVRAAKGDDDREMALRAVIEGSAMVAEKVYLAEWRESRRAVPTARVLGAIRAGAADDVARAYAAAADPGPDGLSKATIEADSQFAYTFGRHWVATRAAANAGRFVAWSKGLFLPERLPRSTRQIIAGADGGSPDPALRLDLTAALAGWRGKNPGCRVLKNEVLGELYCRLWLEPRSLAGATRGGLPPFARLRAGGTLAPFGRTADRFVLVERESTGVAFGAAVVVFDSPGQAAAVRQGLARPGARVRAAAVRGSGRVLVLPIGDECPPELLDAVAAAAGELTPPPPADPAGALWSGLGEYLASGRPADLDRHFDEVRKAADRPAWVAELAPLLFDGLDGNSPAEQARWPAYDARQFALAEKAAADLPRVLTEAELAVLNRAALDTLTDPGAFELGRFNAVRWLTAARPTLTPTEARTAADAVARYYHGRPGFAARARSVFVPTTGGAP